ncbi:MAG TPA: hypothetical protein VGR45_17270 [Stellaceae bacterium]|nr:hypothetical protein [Stellaceae bacterium]
MNFARAMTLAIAGGVIGMSIVGCSNLSNLAQIKVNDTAQAVAVSQAIGDTAGATCAQGFNTLAKSLAATGTTASMDGTMTSIDADIANGIATKVAVARGIKTVIQNDCGALSGEFLSNVLHGLTGPFADLLP